MQQWYQCPRCGSPVAFGVRFCTNCGTQLNWPTQQQPQPPPQYQQQAYNPNDKLYLTPLIVEIDRYKDTNMLFCDAIGKLSTGHVDESVVDYVNEMLASCLAKNRNCAVVCLEVKGGRSVMFPMDIDYEEGLALDCIVTAVRDGKIADGMAPETFRKHIRQIFEKAHAELPRYLQRIIGYKNL